ncbi:MAG TPA: thioredoxin family protein [Fimbriimonadaceae bacterium]|nr:thioredoxin family protein [Fimbriimonadaceae bacterium]
MTYRTAVPLVIGLAAIVFIFGRPRASSGAEPGWYTDFAQAAAQAKKTGQLMMVDFNASWCGPCQMYKQEVFPTAEFKNATKDVVLVDIDMDQNQALGQKFGVSAIPDIRFFSPQGKQLSAVQGYDGAEPLLAQIADAKKALAKN